MWWYSLFTMLLSLPIFTSLDDPSKIDPTRILISTVLDLSSVEIVRDVFTLLRSYRLFGESINNSTFLVCLCVANGELINDDQKLLNELNNLNVEISFIKQTPSPFPKTLNKFEAFKKFDKFRFDYFLWLDADIFIFSDPLKILKSHSYPGEIKCVPDFYNYMVRYPTIIKSSIFWNPKLSTFKLIGKGEDAPHGLCNTGILFFDYLSLQNFLEQLPHSIKEIDNINIFKVDRFLDSLYFVGTVNQRNIQVSILGFEFNYMALFEVEIIHDTITNEIVFGHFLSNTSLFCYFQTPSDICTCLYHNKHIPQNSLIVRKVNDIINSNHCSKLVPLLTKTNVANTSTNTIISQIQNKIVEVKNINDRNVANKNDNNNNNCQKSNNNRHKAWNMNWPLHQSLLLYTDYIIEFNLELSAMENINIECTNINEQYDSYSHEKLTEKEVNDIDDGNYDDIKDVNSGNDLLLDQIMTIKVEDNNLDVMLFNTSTTLSAIILREQSHIIFNVRFYIEISNRLPMTNITVTLTWHEEQYLSETLSLSIVIQLHCLTLLSPGYTSYSFNPLQGLKPLALESQLQWPNYLNIHHITGIGIAVCCDTYKGIQVVKNMIEKWSGDFLLILLVSVPVVPPIASSLTSYTLDKLQIELEAICKNRQFSGGVSCILTQESTSVVSKLMYPKDIYFIYLDFYVDYFAYLEDLKLWFSKLSYSGILAGSRYIHTYGRTASTTITTNKTIIPGIRIRPAVDLFASNVRYMILATYYETNEWMSSSSIGMSSLVENNYPSWYLFKLK